MLKVTHVSALDNCHVYVELDDGSKGEVDITPFFISPFFKALDDENYFAKVALFFTGIGWPEGQDLGPDTLAAKLKPCKTDRKAS